MYNYLNIIRIYNALTDLVDVLKIWYVNIMKKLVSLISGPYVNTYRLEFSEEINYIFYNVILLIIKQMRFNIIWSTRCSVHENY